MVFESLRSKLRGWKEQAPEEIGDVVSEASGRRIRERVLDRYLYDLEMALLESDVALPVVSEITKTLEEELLGKRIRREVSFKAGMWRALRRSLERVLAIPSIDLLDFVKRKEKPVVLMFVGVNGTGKTTVIAKLTHLFQAEGLTCVLAASDTFRAGAVEQLEEHARRLGCRLIKHKAGGDPAAVAYDAVAHARARRRDVVLVDTAGRMQTKANLMEQMKKIKRVSGPDLVIFVGDALTGNDAVEQAKGFDQAVGIDGVILTKIDADARGGAALSISHAVGKPILYLSTGQGYEDLMPFKPSWMVERLLGSASTA
ncbi:MAG: signal recognition particle-docking protein FtsY [Thermoplasmata archaeon]